MVQAALQHPTAVGRIRATPGADEPEALAASLPGGSRGCSSVPDPHRASRGGTVAVGGRGGDTPAGAEGSQCLPWQGSKHRCRGPAVAPSSSGCGGFPTSTNEGCSPLSPPAVTPLSSSAPPRTCGTIPASLASDRGFIPEPTCGSGLGWTRGKLTSGGRSQVLREAVHGVHRGRLTTEIRKDAWIAKSTDSRPGRLEAPIGSGTREQPAAVPAVPPAALSDGPSPGPSPGPSAGPS